MLHYYSLQAEFSAEYFPPSIFRTVVFGEKVTRGRCGVVAFFGFLFFLRFFWVVFWVFFTWFPVMPSTSRVLSCMRNPGSLIMALALFQEISLMPLTTTTHSHTLCTALGGLANERISVTSFLSRSSSASLAASSAGSASARASSAPFCKQPNK